MSWSIDELSSIRVLVADLLDDIGLKSYVFDIEQDLDDWIVSADFSHHGQWQTLDLRVNKAVLRDCLKDDEMRENLRSAWKSKLDRLT